MLANVPPFRNPVTKAALELAKIQFARDEELVGTKAISKQDYDTKKSTVDVQELAFFCGSKVADAW